MDIIQVLFQINAQIAGAVKYRQLDLVLQTEALEQSIDEMDTHLTPLKNFIFPVGNQVIGETHVARAICRRAERKLVQVNKLYGFSNNSQSYVNRLSDWLFTVSRYLAVVANINEIAVVL